MTLKIIRSLLVLIFLFGLTGTSLELLLLGHTEESWQFVPLVLQGLALVILAWYTVVRSRVAMRFFRGLMGLFILSSIAGLILHYQGNVEFELEMYPNLGGFALFWNAITGATPVVGPGNMALLGLIGWVYSFRHPVLLQKRSFSADKTPGVTNP